MDVNSGNEKERKGKRQTGRERERERERSRLHCGNLQEIHVSVKKRTRPRRLAPEKSREIAHFNRRNCQRLKFSFCLIPVRIYECRCMYVCSRASMIPFVIPQKSRVYTVENERLKMEFRVIFCLFCLC